MAEPTGPGPRRGGRRPHRAAVDGRRSAASHPGFAYLHGESDRLAGAAPGRPPTGGAGRRGRAGRPLVGHLSPLRTGRLAADRPHRRHPVGPRSRSARACCNPADAGPLRRGSAARDMIIVERTGPLALLQDLGRPGLAHLGVSPSGAADRTALRPGQPDGRQSAKAPPPSSACGGGLTVRSASPAVGRRSPERPPRCWSTTRRPAPTPPSRCGPATDWPSGRPQHGIRNYLAVRGGFKAPRTLGSRSTDLLSGLGPPPLVDGAGATRRTAPSDACPTPISPRPTNRARPCGCCPGPRRDWFDRRGLDGAARPGLDGQPGLQPGRRSGSSGPDRCARRRTDGAAVGGTGPRRDPGAGVRSAADLRRRPPRHRRLPGDRGAHRPRRRPRRPAATR